MSLSVKHAGVWEEPEPFAKHDGIWKPVQEVWAKHDGIWKEVWSSGITLVVGDAGIGLGRGYQRGSYGSISKEPFTEFPLISLYRVPILGHIQVAFQGNRVTFLGGKGLIINGVSLSPHTGWYRFTEGGANETRRDFSRGSFPFNVGDIYKFKIE